VSTASSQPVAGRASGHTLAARRRRLVGLRPRLAAVPMLVPGLVLVGVFLLWPMVRTVYLSFFTSDGLAPATYTGLDNYAQLLDDPIFVRSTVNTLIWVGGTLILPVVLGLLVALLSSSTRYGAVYRVPIVLPFAISGAAVAVIVGFMLRSDGAINSALEAVGLGALATDWLLSWPANTLSMVAASSWQATGVSVILFLVGLRAIPPETVEAGRLDGARGWSLFRHIVLPQLRPATVVVVGISIANSLKTFDLVWVTTQGGPARSSETLALTMYRETFLLFDQGYGAAVAVFLSVLVVATSWIYLRKQMPEV
jgi:ABC-type sugar transport system permease subunit